GTIPPTGWHQQWGIFPLTETNDGAIFLTLKPTMGQFSSH
ncbi:unnamed protein product, partial [Staurois parvus]